MPRTNTSLDLYLEVTTSRLREHNDPQQQVIILQDLQELVAISRGELSENQLAQVKSAVSDGLGNGWIHINEWQPRDNDKGDSVPSPTESLSEALSNLGAASTWFEFHEDEKNVGHFLEARQPVEIAYQHYIEAEDDVEERPLETLTMAWIEETRSNLATSGDSDSNIILDLDMSNVGWTVERNLRDYTSGYDPVEILCVFAEGLDVVSARLFITPETRVSEVNGRLVLEECEMIVRLWEMIELGNFEVSEKMNEAAWGGLGFDAVEVPKLVFNPETKVIESFEVSGYESFLRFFDN